MIAIADADKIKGLFKKKFPNKTVFKIGKYKNGYLVIASETNNDFNDPYYFVPFLLTPCAQCHSQGFRHSR